MPPKKRNWKKLSDYRCPMQGCGALLKEFKSEVKHRHECTGCSFRISDTKLREILTPKQGKNKWIRRGYGTMVPENF